VVKKDRLVVHAPAGVLTAGDRQNLALAKPELLAYLGAIAALESHRAQRLAAQRPSRQRVLLVYRAVIERHLQQGSPTLLDDPAAVASLLRRWEYPDRAPEPWLDDATDCGNTHGVLEVRPGSREDKACAL
jgi:hypothetical protein